MEKRGQTTVFIIIAIVIVLAIVVFFVFREKISESLFKKQTEEQIAFEAETRNVYSVIEECVLEGLVDGARLIGLQGGYLILPKKYVKLNSSEVAYGYYLKSRTLRPKKDIEKDIAYYIDLTFPYCFDVDDFDDLEIEIRDTESEVKVTEGLISVSTRVYIHVSRGNLGLIIKEKYSAEAPIKLNEIYETAEGIIKKQAENPDFIDLTYLAELDYDVTILPYSDDIIIYSINDENKENPGYYYVFRFANKLE